jgi:hypothetical protein
MGLLWSSLPYVNFWTHIMLTDVWRNVGGQVSLCVKRLVYTNDKGEVVKGVCSNFLCNATSHTTASQLTICGHSQFCFCSQCLFSSIIPWHTWQGCGCPLILGWGFCLNVSVKLEIVAPVHSAWAHVGISSVFAFSLLGWRQTFWSVLFCLLTVNAYTLSSGKIPTAAHC